MLSALAIANNIFPLEFVSSNSNVVKKWMAIDMTLRDTAEELNYGIFSELPPFAPNNKTKAEESFCYTPKEESGCILRIRFFLVILQ